jgi:hypothetical protein
MALPRIDTAQVRLNADVPFFVFDKIPVGASVLARIGGVNQTFYGTDGSQLQAQLNVPQKYVFEYAPLPNFSFGGVSGIRTTGEVFNWTANFSVNPRDPRKFVPAAWGALTPAQSGNVQPSGALEHLFKMPGSTGYQADLAETNRSMLRVRRKGDVVVSNEVLIGTGSAGPYTIQLLNTDIVPGSVVITVPTAGAPLVVRDSGFVDINTGLALLGGDVSGTVDSTINYATGEVIVTFSAVVIAPTVTPVAGEILTAADVAVLVGTLANPNVVPGTLVVNSTNENFTDNSDGTLTGDNGGSGIIDYLTGDFTLNFGTTSGAGNTTADYDYYSANLGEIDYEATYNKMPVDVMVEYNSDLL